MTDSPELVVVCGLPGVGKSGVARTVAERLDATLLRTDAVRKELVDEPAYTSEETERTYETICARARELLDADSRDTGGRVVLDGTYRSRRFREGIAEMATDLDVDCEFVYVTCDTDVVRERIQQRTDTVSDATYENHLELNAAFDALERDHTRLDNSGSWERTRERLDDVLRSV
jgi:predicted kinase